MASQRNPVRLALLKAGHRLASLLGQVLGGGTQMAEAYFKLRLARDYEYRPRPDDVFVVSFPKSGTTLIQMMLYQLTTPGKMDFPHIDSISPWFEFYLFDLAKVAEEAPSPRIFKSHLRYEELPRGVRTIYVMRELRDVVISAFHHFRLVRGWRPDLGFDEFVDSMLAGRNLFGSWSRHVESWWPHRNDPHVLFLRYEEVIADLPGTIRRVAAFCGLPLDEATAARVLERCSFSFMKRHDAKFDPRLRQLAGERGEFIRKGVAGEGRTLLTPLQEERIAGHLASLAGRLGCRPDDLHHELLAGRTEAG